MTWILITWLAIIMADIIRNWVIIEVKKQRPNYFWSNVLRIAVGFVFWLLSPVLFRMTEWQWWSMIPMMLFTFWYCFDYGLTQFRNTFNINNKPRIVFDYLNPNGSWLDRMQCKYPDKYPWFWFKFFLMLAGIALYFYGLDAIWTVKW